MRALALAGGFAGLGAAPRDSFEGVPEAADPARVLEDYRAILVLAAPPGLVSSSGPYGPVLLEPPAFEALAAIRRSLEEEGFEARPVVSGDVSLPRAAAEAGLGEIAPVGALVAREYGLSLTLVGLVTDAPLPGPSVGPRSALDDGTISGSSEVSARICRDCGRCVEDCPATLPGSFDLAWCTGCGACLVVCPLGPESD